LLLGCGHSEEEWQQAQTDITHLKADLDAANRRHTEDEQNFATTQRELETLQDKLRDLGGPSRAEQELRDQLIACQTRTCPQGSAETSSPFVAPNGQQPVAKDAARATPAGTPSDGARTIPYEGNGGGPTLCADGQVSGSSGRGTCSHHGGVAGGHHRKH
jgi:hypothetical protein